MLSLCTSSFAFSAPTVVPRVTISMAAIEPEMPQVPEEIPAPPPPLISIIRVGDKQLAGDLNCEPPHSNCCVQSFHAECLREQCCYHVVWTLPNAYG